MSTAAIISLQHHHHHHHHRYHTRYNSSLDQPLYYKLRSRLTNTRRDPNKTNLIEQNHHKRTTTVTPTPATATTTTINQKTVKKLSIGTKIQSPFQQRGIKITDTALSHDCNKWLACVDPPAYISFPDRFWNEISDDSIVVAWCLSHRRHLHSWLYHCFHCFDASGVTFLLEQLLVHSYSGVIHCVNHKASNPLFNVHHSCVTTVVPWALDLLHPHSHLQRRVQGLHIVSKVHTTMWFVVDGQLHPIELKLSIHNANV